MDLSQPGSTRFLVQHHATAKFGEFVVQARSAHARRVPRRREELVRIGKNESRGLLKLGSARYSLQTSRPPRPADQSCGRAAHDVCARASRWRVGIVGVCSAMHGRWACWTSTSCTWCHLGARDLSSLGSDVPRVQPPGPAKLDVSAIPVI